MQRIARVPLGDKGTKLVAHQTIEDPSRLLSVDQIGVDLARMAHAVLHTRLGDLIEFHALAIVLGQTEDIRKVPGDRFSLAIGVGREPDVFAFVGKAFQLLDELLLALDDIVFGGKVVLDIHAETRLRQITDVSHRRDDLKVASEIFFDCLCFGGRLHYNQI